MGNILKKNIGRPGNSGTFFPTLKEVSESFMDSINVNKPKLRSLDAEHPSWRQMAHVQMGLQTVQLPKIVGSAHRHMDFYEDWTDARTDDSEKDKARWDRILKAVRQGKRPDDIGGPGQRIHLFKLGENYWVGDDGNRRVALAKRMKLEELLCEVSEVLDSGG